MIEHEGIYVRLIEFQDYNVKTKVSVPTGSIMAICQSPVREDMTILWLGDTIKLCVVGTYLQTCRRIEGTA